MTTLQQARASLIQIQAQAESTCEPALVQMAVLADYLNTQVPLNVENEELKQKLAYAEAFVNRVKALSQTYETMNTPLVWSEGDFASLSTHSLQEFKTQHQLTPAALTVRNTGGAGSSYPGGGGSSYPGGGGNFPDKTFGGGGGSSYNGGAPPPHVRSPGVIVFGCTCAHCGALRVARP